jgi:hypothetical protein
MKKNARIVLVAFAGLILSRLFAHGVDEPLDRKSMIEMNEQMAKTHEKIAESLKSDRSDKDCMGEMNANCPLIEMMGEGDMKGQDLEK